MKKIYKLITNADDFGMTKGITDTIIDTHINGILKSATIMPNMSATEYAVKLAKIYPSLGVGIHFTLTEGMPVSDSKKVPLLIDSNGFFYENAVQRKNFIIGKEIYKQIKMELSAQLEKILDLGLKPSHFDSHHHITGTPLGLFAATEVFQNYNIKVARTTSVRYYSVSGATIKQKLLVLNNNIKHLPKQLIHLTNKFILRYLGFSTPNTKMLINSVLPEQNDYIKQFLNVLLLLNDGITEIAFHPGKFGDCSEDSVTMSEIRNRDYEILISTEVREFIDQTGIEIGNFKTFFL